VSVEITRSGTRGAGVLHGPLRPVAARLALLGFRLGFGRRMNDLPVLLLTTRGARSNRMRTAPLLCFPEGESSWLVVASAAGAARHPAWFLNAARHPESVWLDVDGRSVHVTPESLGGAARQHAWRHIVARSPKFARFERRTDREIPVVRLTASG
jgi:deazaflavin-dependent oxidoreductase (nitroreductase family)